jgi:hypothetical protein
VLKKNVLMIVVSIIDPSLTLRMTNKEEAHGDKKGEGLG